MPVKATVSNTGISPKKVRPTVDLVRGRKVDEALTILKFMPSPTARCIEKVIGSAIANAENNQQYDIDKLYIKEAYVGKSIVLKRFRPRAKGRASGIKKPYSNLTIILSENINQKKVLHGSKS